MTLAGGALREGLIYGLLGNNHDCDAGIAPPTA
jgi:exopolyphosphatase/guanosine-5'-triphosphate,3'-diphosphate pyrophosphatase